MRTLLINLPWNENARVGVRAGSRWPFTYKLDKDEAMHYLPFPFFLAYATALLKKNNFEAKLIDAIAERMGENQVITEIKSYSPGLLVIETSTPSFANDICLAIKIKEKAADCKIALCGPHASVFPDEILRDYGFIDFILIGEYEYILLDLVKQPGGDLDLSSVSGLAYRNISGVKINSLRSTIQNLDDLPWPERETLPIYKYNDGFCGLPRPNVQMWASRGCPFHCSFCLWPQTMYLEHTYRKRDPAKVADEMQWLIEGLRFKAVYFDDDVFNIDKNYVFNMCAEIKKRKIKVPWAVMSRADLMDEEMLRELAGSGLFAIKYGLESADQRILDSCKKKLNLEYASKMIEVTKRLGIKVHLTFCLGLPGEDRKTARETLDFINNIQPDSLQVSYATPFPGTKYYEYAKDKNYLLSGDWREFDGGQGCIVRTEELTGDELRQIRNDFYSSFDL
ncbi:MAG: radical SAM protein [Candidatus Omnitrophica bacterium]|nr:radical SAM protein [Candidatus Omnitrophota bacterium]MBU1869705.1 radical SAM protein [Candidatus Omnitrophota bacterium]